MDPGQEMYILVTVVALDTAQSLARSKRLAVALFSSSLWVCRPALNQPWWTPALPALSPGSYFLASFPLGTVFVFSGPSSPALHHCPSGLIRSAFHKCTGLVTGVKDPAGWAPHALIPSPLL